jgi:hypothetical protein
MLFVCDHLYNIKFRHLMRVDVLIDMEFMILLRRLDVYLTSLADQTDV